MKGRTLKWLIELKEVKLNNEVSGKTGIRAATGNLALAIGPFKWFNVFL